MEFYDHFTDWEMLRKAGMRKWWKWQIFAEAGSSKRVPLPFWPFISNVKNLNVVQFFVKNKTKFLVQETVFAKKPF